MINEEIFALAIRTNGAEKQERIAIEECSELIQAISHKHRGREHNIPEEIADVEICIEQLKLINGCTGEVAAIKAEKIRRLYDDICDKCF